ncbi:MAG: hypothetical protein M3094_07205, partial [Actinomycetia bacterium]|nr:hypothetical protein [Actinomycetes bacterium]
MLIIGLVVAAIIGPLFVWRNNENRSIKRYGIGSAAAVVGAAAPAIGMGQCGFADGATGVDHLFMYGLMFGGGWLALLAAQSFWDRADGKRKDSAAFA